VSACAVVCSRVELSCSREFLLRGGAAILADSQNGDIITLSFPHFFFNNDEGRAEDQELG
jgi:hypothetical protein